MDPSIIEAIASAVDASPGNIPLRLHLVSLLMQAERAAEALSHCTVILESEPAHLDALDAAARAATAIGESGRAQGYRQLLQALGRAEQKRNDPEPAPVRMTETPGTTGLDESGQLVPLHEDLFDTPTPEVDSSQRRVITLDDVGGMSEVKRRLDLSFLAPLRNPDMMKLYGKSVRGGLLLYGPPGCGKTYIARAIAGELQARFLTVGLADILDMYLGQSEKNVRAVFDEARRNAPCVLFLDEIDALGRKRSLTRHNIGGGVINQLLSEMDGVDGNNDGVFIVAATNHPWDVDSALRRPGRFDRTLLVLPPDREARVAIIELHLRNRPVAGVDVASIAEKTADYSGADLAFICEAAAELAMEDSLQSGVARPIGPNDFRRALAGIRPSVGPWFDTARNYATFANEGGMYDDLIAYMKQRRM
jgi:AAA+ superfamily predicted ATPase